MSFEIISVACGGPGFKEPSGLPVTVINNADNRRTPCECYQEALEKTTAKTLIYVHDDLEIHESSWFSWILHPFNENIAAVGLGGATALGNCDLYRTPFNIWNMARRGYASNQADAETHGERFTGTRRVAVLDAFVMAVRVEWLRSRGGWPVKHLTHHCLDLWLACEAARDKKEIWQVGISCTHHGGGSSTKPAYQDAKWLQGKSIEGDHLLPHRWLYEEYRDVLPIEI